MTTVVSIWLALTLAVSAGLKSWRRDRAAEALSTYGVPSSLRAPSLHALVGVEIVLALLLTLEVACAPVATAGLLLLFTALTGGALLRGRGGRPCACFGSKSRLSWISPARAGALAALAGALALGWLGQAPSGYERWMTVGLSLSVAAIIALAVAVFALAREVGVLRLGMAGRGALEIPHEGPPLGVEQAWAAAIHAGPRALLRLAVFTSAGCPLCRQVSPAVAHVAGDPLLAVRIFDEEADPAAWTQSQVPGAPYAVALSLEGAVLAKGTFNSLGQLESILATARSRERELPVAA